MQLSVCAETLYSEASILERLGKIRKHGIEHVEFWTMQSRSPTDVREALTANGQQLVLFCGNMAHALIDPNQREGLVEELSQSIGHARAVSCPHVAVLTNAMGEGGIPVPSPQGVSERDQAQSLYEGLCDAVGMAESADLTLLIEPLNTTVDHPDYYLQHSEQAFRLIRAVGSPRLKVLFDIYHLQIMEGDIVRTLEAHLDVIGHIHVADVPGRHEPGTGEINWRRIAEALRANGYEGMVGLECFPIADSDSAIRAFRTVFGGSESTGSRS